MIGSPIDEETAKQLAERFWKAHHIMGVRNGKVYLNKTDEPQFVNLAQQHGYSEFYIFNNTEGKGYVILAADDRITPVLGYSYENNFDAETLPPNLKAWLDGYAEQIRATVRMGIPATDEIHTEWDCLRQGKTLPIKSETAVSPLISTKWNQSPYVNELCPYDYSVNKRTLTGCVATAMAQIMRYWSYPEHGYGSHSYVPTSHPEYGSLYADFSSVNYQWSSMPNTVSSNNNAVATLMYHCGISVDMDYGTPGNPDNGSAAYIIDNNGRPCAESALKTYFDYKSTLHHVIKSNYSDSQWTNAIKNELDNARPILYGGFNTKGGHAFICDGYNNNGYFHFNWGWGGQYNDYFYINTLNPGTYEYSSGQQALIGIEPSHGNGGGGGGGGGSEPENFNLVYYSNLTMDNNEYWFYDDLSVNAKVINVGSVGFNGYIGAGIFRKNENGEYRFLNVMGYWRFLTNTLQPNQYVQGTLECAGGPPYVPGSYGIAMIYSLDGNLWNLIDNQDYHNVFFDIVYAANIETFSDFTITTGNYLYYGETATINVDIINTGNSTFSGKFRVNLANENGSWAQNIAIVNCPSGFDHGYHFTNGCNFTGPITMEPGSYYLELGFQNEGDDGWYYAGASYHQNPVRVEVVAAPVTSDRYETNNSVGSAYKLPVSFSNNSTTVSTTGSNFHDSNDIDYYKIQLNPGKNYIITPRLYDSYNSGNGMYYTVDAQFAYSTDGTNWSMYYDDEMTTNISVAGGSTLYFCVTPYFEGKTGTYLLDINITAGTGVDESDGTRFCVYPNPVSGILNVNCKDYKEIKLINPLGVTVSTCSAEGKETLQFDLSDLPCGTCILQAIGDHHFVTRQVVKTE